MHSVLFERGHVCTNQCLRKSCLYLHRNCSRTVCPCETITSVPSLSPVTPPQLRPGRARAVWPQGWNCTSSACLDATDLFVQCLWALFSFLFLPGCSLLAFIFFPGPRLQRTLLKSQRSLEEQKMAFWRRKGAHTPHRVQTPLPSSIHSAAQISCWQMTTCSWRRSLVNYDRSKEGNREIAGNAVASLGVNQQQWLRGMPWADPGGLLALSEPVNRSAACCGGQSSRTGLLLLETTFAQSLLKPLHSKCTD